MKKGTETLVEAISFLDGIIVQLEDNPDMEKMTASMVAYGLLVPIIGEPHKEGLAPDEIRGLATGGQKPVVRKIKELRQAQVEICKGAIAVLRGLLTEFEHSEDIPI